MKLESYHKYGILLSVVVISCLLVAIMPAIPQDLNYHIYADRRSFAGIDYILNVISNIPFVWVGISGIWTLFKHPEIKLENRIFPAYLYFFIGVACVGIGSSYYHLAPSNETLVWDRLPMTLAFIAFFTIILAEFVSVRVAKIALYPLLILGIISVFYWYLTELSGAGDLRLYGLVQFLPLLLIPLILLLFPATYSHSFFYWVLYLMYGLAKLFEWADFEIFIFLRGLSGHTLKHLFAAIGCYSFLLQIKKRIRLTDL